MPPVDWFPTLLPAVLVACGGLLCLGFEPFLDRAGKHRLLPWLAAIALFAAGVAQACLAGNGVVGGVLAMDGARAWLCLAAIAAALISQAGMQQSLARDDYPGGEPYALSLFATTGVLVMVMAVNSIALFLGLELASLSVYALVGLRRHRTDSNEALFKYFIMGAVFSAIFLYGAALTYGATGSVQSGHAPLVGREALFHLGQGLMLIGLLFKVGAVPFHFWSPDAYTGAPAAVTGFMGAVIKVGGFAALGNWWLSLVAIENGRAAGVLSLAEPVLTGGGLPGLDRFKLVIMVVALFSLVLGNFSALRQTSARRLLAFSSVAHAGYMLLAFDLPAGVGTVNLSGLWFYLVGYAVATAGALTALATLSGREDTGDDLVGLAGQGRAHPFHGVVATIFLVSFAGVPPTAGFLGKYLIFAGLVGKGQLYVTLFAMVMAVVGAAYYFRLVVTLWGGGRSDRSATPVPALSTWTLGLAAAAMLLLVVAPRELGGLGRGVKPPATKNTVAVPGVPVPVPVPVPVAAATAP